MPFSKSNSHKPFAVNVKQNPNVLGAHVERYWFKHSTSTKKRARVREETEEYRQLYRKRAGIEGTISQGVRAFGLRRCRYVGADTWGWQKLIYNMFSQPLPSIGVG